MAIDVPDWSRGVRNEPGNKITSSRPPQSLGKILIAPSTTSTITTAVLPSDIHALVVVFGDALANYAHCKIAWSGGSATAWVPFELYNFPQAVYALPILPSETPAGGASNTRLDITLQTNANGFGSVEVWAIFEGEPEWLTIWPQPQLAPNQTPKHVELTLANDVGQWLIAPVANVQITIFKIDIVYFNPGGANIAWYIGHATALPGAGLTPIISQILSVGFQINTYTPIDLRGAQLPRGEGIYAIQELGANQNFGAELIYSLS